MCRVVDLQQAVEYHVSVLTDVALASGQLTVAEADAPDVRGFWIRDGKIEEAELDVG